MHQHPFASNDEPGTTLGVEYSGNHIGSDFGPHSCGSCARAAACNNLSVVCGN